MSRSHSFSRPLRQLHVISSSFDWFTGLPVSFVIGWSDYFENRCKTLVLVWLYDTQLKTAVNVTSLCNCT